MSRPSIRITWQRQLASLTQVLVAVDANTSIESFRVRAESLLRDLPLPANHGERLIAQAVLTAVSLRRVGFDVQDVVYTVCGDQGRRLISPPNEPSHHREKSEIAERAKAVIDRDFACSGLTVQALARRLHAHRNRVSLEFRKAFGTSIADYLNQRRVLAAAEMLHTHKHQISIKTVAAAVGYRGSGFYRHFKQTIGTTPARYRRD